MDEQNNWVLLLLSFLETWRGENPALNLLLGAVKPEVLARAQALAFECVFRKLGQLFDLRLRYIQVFRKSANDENIVGRGERGTCEQEAAVGERLDSRDRATLGKGSWRVVFGWEVWVCSGLRRSRRYRDCEDLDACVVASGDIKDFTLWRKLDKYQQLPGVGPIRNRTEDLRQALTQSDPTSESACIGCLSRGHILQPFLGLTRSRPCPARPTPPYCPEH